MLERQKCKNNIYLLFSHNLTCFLFVDFSPTPSAPEDVSVKKPIVNSSADGEITVAVVEGSSIVRVVEEAATADVVATTTMAVVEMGTGTAESATEISGQGGGSSDHRAGKEIVEDVPPSPRKEAAASESEEEEDFNFCSDFCSPAPPMGSSVSRSRGRVPHPKDIPTSVDIFDDGRLERVWWECIDRMDGLKDPSEVVSLFARQSMNVSCSDNIHILCLLLASYCPLFL